MLQKFALAFKTKTIEFFAEEEEEEEDDNGSIRAVDDLVGPTADAIITDQRVVVLKPDPAPALAPAPVPPPAVQNPNPSCDRETLISTLFATLSSFESAYLHVQTAHSPVLPSALCSADAAAVSHLRRLSDLKHSFPSPGSSSIPDSKPIDLNSCLQAQVLDNQNLLRTFDAVINRLQADIDRKDAESAELKLGLNELELINERLAARLDRACAPTPGEGNIENLLSVSVFDSVLRDSCRIMHRFAKSLADLMRRNGWDLFSVAKSIYPDANYAKQGHCRYTILSHVCLRMFDGFDLYGFGIRSDESEPDLLVSRDDSLRQFIEHSAVDPLELIDADPHSEFAQFCERKYNKVIQPGTGSGFLGSFEPASPLYEPFVAMASSIWALHLLAWAYDPAVEIFQVGHGREFSIVYMENILRRKVGTLCGKVTRPKVGFTVVPGFRVGGTVVQCRVYLDPSS
ncbi:Cell cycle progression protein 1 [Rhynchospora pubera]|uniref:Cell cycle progression protein 1 n=1 Tax=Rhynchospora pubera TaxID=906938 RepID=A0AAV8BPB7_9POAL|nr:Cell cycle progression protein 1 [Rhynchospora pubera]